MTDEYRRLHKCCPRCGSKSNKQTYVAYLGDEDLNKVECNGCGWIGTVHELSGKNIEFARIVYETPHFKKLYHEDPIFNVLLDHLISTIESPEDVVQLFYTVCKDRKELSDRLLDLSKH